MCGICGMTGGFAHSTSDVIHPMLDTLYARGPDDFGIYHQPGITLAMRRLAIIDIAGGHQPMQDAASGVTIVFNGEIYNYQDLKTGLAKKNHDFTTHSDTEVILRGYLAQGKDFITQLNGMFAIAIWDPRINQLLLSRDHLGQKPLYYFHGRNGLIFGSDLRTLCAHPELPKELNHAALSAYLQLRHIPGPDTILRNVKQVMPGHHLILSQENQITLECYWHASYTPDDSMTTATAVDEFWSLWPRVVKRHLQSEVQVGAFLSGGIDSSLIVFEAVKHVHELKTFTVSFNEHGFDETPYAQQVADYLGCRHEVLHFDAPFDQLLERWSKAYDQPFSDPASFPSLMMTQAAKSRVTVALSGDGGDELFAGYQRYKSTVFARKCAWIPTPLRQAVSSLIRLAAKLLSTRSPSRVKLDAIARRLALIDAHVEREYTSQFHIINDTVLNELSRLPQTTSAAQHHIAGPLITWMLKHDLEHWLPDQMLVKTDRASMANSLEMRLPFLDREIVEFSTRIPSTLQMSGGKLKHILRSAGKKVLPDQITKRPKHGFAVPVDRILIDNQSLVSDIFSSELPKHGEYLNAKPIIARWKAHQEMKANHGEALLTIMLFLLWHRIFFNTFISRQ